MSGAKSVSSVLKGCTLEILTASIAPAVVTGGGSGIGAMFAAAYVQNGAKVYIASRKEKQLREVRR